MINLPPVEEACWKLHVARLTMVAAGDNPSEISEATREQIVLLVAILAGVPASAVRLTIVAASLRLS